MCGLNQWIGGARRLSCSATMRRGGLRRISQSCRSCYGNPERSLLAACAVYAPLTKTAAPLTPQKNAPWGTYRELQPERGRNACGVYKETLRQSIKTGRLTGTKDALGHWRIEPAELHAVYPYLYVVELA